MSERTYQNLVKFISRGETLIAGALVAFSVGAFFFKQSWWPWPLAFFVWLSLGGAAAKHFVKFMHWLAQLPEKIGKEDRRDIFDFLLGLVERVAIGLIFLASQHAALAFAGGWIGLKIAANWGKEGKIESYHWPRGTTKKQKWVSVSRGTLAAICGSAVSLGFGILGGLIIKYAGSP